MINWILLFYLFRKCAHCLHCQGFYVCKIYISHGDCVVTQSIAMTYALAMAGQVSVGQYVGTEQDGSFSFDCKNAKNEAIFHMYPHWRFEGNSLINIRINFKISWLARRMKRLEILPLFKTYYGQWLTYFLIYCIQRLGNVQ